jgi:hypothetical protein
MSKKVTSTKQIFRIINDDLDKASICGDIDRPVILHRLKTINEELCDQVVTLVKRLETLKEERHEQDNNRILREAM